MDAKADELIQDIVAGAGVVEGMARVVLDHADRRAKCAEKLVSVAEVIIEAFRAMGLGSHLKGNL
ncbi:hypothetical protein [Microbacterium sp. NPDC056052]|uniref:hypothetical protein n=1 Tax=Microbacterium sp. NPDC056052 TaxID=3345695 RepID=UPI0035DC2756